MCISFFIYTYYFLCKKYVEKASMFHFFVGKKISDTWRSVSQIAGFFIRWGNLLVLASTFIV